tara:strand:- start:107 stop:448 length:342 start_codon:yes stop_codon:yes gene_type:complete
MLATVWWHLRPWVNWCARLLTGRSEYFSESLGEGADVDTCTYHTPRALLKTEPATVPGARRDKESVWGDEGPACAAALELLDAPAADRSDAQVVTLKSVRGWKKFLVDLTRSF